MTQQSSLPQHFAAAVLAAIAVFLALYTWLPSRDGLQLDAAVVSAITPQRNTWFEVALTTSSGKRITCRTRRGWPLLGPSRCPLAAFETLLGQRVSVLHDDQRAFEVRAGSQIVVDYWAHRKQQTIALVLAGLLLVTALRVAGFSFRSR